MTSISKPGADAMAAEQLQPPMSSLAADTALRRREPGLNATNFSPAQKRFDALLARIDKLKTQLADLQTLADAHRVVYQATIAPLRHRSALALKELALWLDQRLQRGGLPAAQFKQGTAILLSLCASFAASGDDEMRALHDQRSPQSLEQLKLACLAETQRKMGAGFASRPGEFVDDCAAGNPEEGKQHGAGFEAGIDDLREAALAQQVQQQQMEASAVLRKIYRQLASVLHPDREQNPAELPRKTDLMGQANAAYVQQDLEALLRLQLQIEQASSQSLLKLPNEKIPALVRLLKVQADQLKEALLGQQIILIQEFNLSPYDTLTAACLRSALRQQQQELELCAHNLKSDLQDMKRGPGLKRWIKRETRLLHAAARDRTQFPQISRTDRS